MKKNTQSRKKADYSQVVRVGMALSVAILTDKAYKSKALALEREYQSDEYYSLASAPRGVQQTHAGLCKQAYKLLSNVTMPKAAGADYLGRKFDSRQEALRLKQDAYNFMVKAVRKGFPASIDLNVVREKLATQIKVWNGSV